jgi:hypothetical protein
MQDDQDKHTSTDELQREQKRIQKNPDGVIGLFSLT